MPDIDFAEVKSRFPILKVCELLGLELKPEQSGHFFRGQCPFCQKARTFRVTPSAGLFGCFACRDAGEPDCRGDQIALVQKIKGFKSALQAAKWLTGDEEHQVDRQPDPVGGTRGMEELDYLDPSHDDVQLLGFEPEDAKRIGIGYAPKGTRRGEVLIPIRLTDGSCVGYIGATEITLPKEWHFPSEKIVPMRRRKA